jgi:alpha-L-fucosidase 2
MRPLFLAACLLVALSAGARGDQTKTDLEYGRAGGQRLLLDMGIPNGPGPFPVAVIVHGGGWASGDKASDITPLFPALTDAGILWVSIDYRLAPQNRWPDCFDDVRTAIRWVKAHAAEYGGDPDRIGLIGYSAGAHLACLAATTAGPDTRVQAVVGLAAPTDLVQDTARRGGLSKSLQDLLGRTTLDAPTRALLAEMSPLYHVHAGLPPFLLIQGTADHSVPFVQSLVFRQRLKAAGVPCRLIAIDGAPHNIAKWAALDPDYPAQVADWLRETLGEPNKNGKNK